MHGVLECMHLLSMHVFGIDKYIYFSEVEYKRLVYLDFLLYSITKIYFRLKEIKKLKKDNNGNGV